MGRISAIGRAVAMVVDWSLIWTWLTADRRLMISFIKPTANGTLANEPDAKTPKIPNQFSPRE